jgi:peptidyl-prolyl cis-trans isomerase C
MKTRTLLLSVLIIAATAHAQPIASGNTTQSVASSDKPAQARPSIVDNPVLVRGASIEIRRNDFDMEKLSVPPEQRAQFATSMERIQRTLERLTVNRALLNELRANGFDKDPQVVAELDYAMNQKLVSMYIARFSAEVKLPDLEPALRERYKLNAATLTEPEKIRASHILIATKTRTKEEARKRAEEVREKALAGSPFPELVKLYSDDPSARRNDGDLGYFPAAQMVPEFSKAAFAMTKEGQISEPVESEFGYHIIRYQDRLPPRTPTYEQVRQVYLEDAEREFRAQALRQKLDEIISKQKPEVNMDEVKKLLDNDTAKAAREFNAKIRKEIEAAQAKSR